VKLRKKAIQKLAVKKIGFFIPDLIHIVKIRYGLLSRYRELFLRFSILKKELLSQPRGKL